MSDRSKHDVRRKTACPKPEGSERWTESLLREAVESLQRRHAGCCQPAVVEEVVRLGRQEKVWKALCERTDPEVAVRDLYTRCAFAALMVDGRAIYELDPTSQVLIQRALDLIYSIDDRMARRFGEHPLDEDPGLLLSICKCLSRYVPRKPMYRHIRWKIEHYESSVSRAMRQIEYLVRQPGVTELFVAYVQGAEVPDILKAELLQLARGGGRRGVNNEAVIRFFALPATIAFVKSCASRVQTARTLYDEEEYRGIAWQGRRRLPANRRHGYLDAALASLERRWEASLDTDDYDLHDLLGSWGGPDGPEPPAVAG